MGPLVSILIPVYNSEKFLEECIISALNQTYDNIEVIAINDGSTDESLKILQRFSGKITVINQENRGLAKALMAGINKMTGKWLKWFSPDDILFPYAIEALVTEAKKLPENTIIYSNWDLIDENGDKLRSFSEPNYNNLEKFDFNVRLLDGQQINVNTTLIPSFLFENGCLIEELDDPVAIDYDFFLRAGILYATQFYLIPKSLVKFRVHANQLSHKNIAQTLSYLPKVRNKVLSRLDETKRKEYLKSLQEYKNKKPISKKTMEKGLKVITSTMPDWITDRLIILYLNKIRRTR